MCSDYVQESDRKMNDSNSYLDIIIPYTINKYLCMYVQVGMCIYRYSSSTEKKRRG